MIILFILDIDECTLDTDGCQHTCTNNEGSFICGCNDGYELNEDGLNCDGKLLQEGIC